VAFSKNFLVSRNFGRRKRKMIIENVLIRSYIRRVLETDLGCPKY